MFTWGVNDEKALGRTGVEFEPQPVALSHKFIRVACCDSATFAIAADGRLYGCGTFRVHGKKSRRGLDKRLTHDATRMPTVSSVSARTFASKKALSSLPTLPSTLYCLYLPLLCVAHWFFWLSLWTWPRGIVTWSH